MNPINLSWSKLVVTAVSVVALSPISSALAVSRLSSPVASKFSNSPQTRLLVGQSDSRGIDIPLGTSFSPEKKSAFTLYIWQPGGTIKEVIARISIKSKYGNKYRQERFLGDYKYKIKQKAKFVKGFKLGDRIVIRLYDTSNRFIGYSEFVCLPENTAVNLILSANPTENKVVRTFYGFDANNDSIVDNTNAYDYFTEVNNQKVTFLNSSEKINIVQYQAAGFAKVATTGVYPTSFSEGDFAVAGKSVNAFDSNLAKALTANPGSLVKLTPIQDNSSFELGKLLSEYRTIGVGKGIQISFSDISKNYWAKEYISELAAMEVIGGFPDGTFRPNAPVTRAELAALLQKVFIKSKVREAINFKDVPKRYWAYDAIRETYEMGFFTILNSKNFNPTQKLNRLDVLITLAKGLNYKFTGSTENILAVYSDASSIRNEHRNFIAALTENNVITNYPNKKLLNSKKVATRADVCALLYRAMVSAGEVPDLPAK
ncbi:MAG: S-layer homology domain-containing protein [Aphanizomenon flos-aquae KM1D3_PB]|uniref:S-layer homology domain-containing protein n=1 Tax=Aphanizomenon flos-aquae TaxID=1176 RepID=UPI000541B602|nr:S-layer homology domain-containing protein [Aphanizomenon flos-aquae]KHG39650.1 S-layer domain-containing protein [Aphanizomenon flos-aquae 2012/KM1/D3]QSV70994.1 MAG: S-layer homology domain-containing protein [Aphanizomenon flos-aquae KM1D3_PB]